MDYSKWDKLDVSDDEKDEYMSTSAMKERQEDMSNRVDFKGRIDRWIVKRMHRLAEKKRNEFGVQGYVDTEHDISPTDTITPRKVTKEERQTLAFLLAITEFKEGETNLDRHVAILDHFRQHRWLEEDPGTLEFLCQLHGKILDEDKADDDPVIRRALLCAINTIAAPVRAKYANGIREFISAICTPSNDKERELRKKWQTLDFGRDALFESMFPLLRQYGTEDGSKSDNEFWFFICLTAVVMIALAVGLYLYYMHYSSGRHTPTPKVSTTTVPPKATEL